MRLPNLVAAIIGIASGVAANSALSFLALQLFPPPLELNWEDQAALRGYILSLPVAAFVLVLFAHLSQAFVGAVVCASLQASAAHWPWVLIASLSLAGGAMNFWSIPHPPWMYAELPGYFVAAAAGAALGCHRPRHRVAE
jgi:hypothetical protein